MTKKRENDGTYLVCLPLRPFTSSQEQSQYLIKLVHIKFIQEKKDVDYFPSNEFMNCYLTRTRRSCLPSIFSSLSIIKQILHTMVFYSPYVTIWTWQSDFYYAIVHHQLKQLIFIIKRNKIKWFLLFRRNSIVYLLRFYLQSTWPYDLRCCSQYSYNWQNK